MEIFIAKVNSNKFIKIGETAEQLEVFKLNKEPDPREFDENGLTEYGINKLLKNIK